jgi:hypothetical protein
MSDITPTDGISDYWIEMKGLDKKRNGAVVSFEIIRVINGLDEHQATLNFSVQSQSDGLNGLIARAHDDLVAALRQMLYTADTMRQSYKTSAEKESRAER